VLDFKLLQRHRCRVQPRRRAGLEPLKNQSDLSKIIRKFIGRRFVEPPAGKLLGSNVH